jgi:putative flippase GtrA
MGVKNPREMLTAGLGGIAATAVDICLLVLMVESGVSVPAAAFFASFAGAAVNFVVNKYIAFRDRSPITIQQLSRFGVVAVATAMWMALAMKVVAVELGVPYVVAKLVCAVLVFVAWTYPAQRRLVFGRPATSPTWRVDVDADADVSAA